MVSHEAGIENGNVLASAVERNDWDRADIAVGQLVRRVTDALLNRSYDWSERLYPLAEQIYSKLRVRESLPAEGRAMEGQLRALTTLLSYARQFRPRQGLPDIVGDANMHPLLEALDRAGKPLTVNEIARATGWKLETVSRKLSALRAAGMLDWKKAGRTTLNDFTADGRKAMSEHMKQKAPSAPNSPIWPSSPGSP